MSNNDEYGADSWYGKHTGETYKEADQRKVEEHRQTMEDLAQSQRDENNRASTTGTSGGGGGGSIGSLGLPGEKTAFGHFISKVGFWGLGIGICLWFFHQSSPSIIGEKLPMLVIGVGIACLALIYLFQVVMFILTAVTILFIWYEGSRSPEGFHLSAVPIWAYVVSGGAIFMGYLLKKALCHD